jgi:hypothetical protein
MPRKTEFTQLMGLKRRMHYGPNEKPEYECSFVVQQLTTWSRVLVGNLVVCHSLERFSAFFVALSFVAVLKEGPRRASRRYFLPNLSQRYRRYFDISRSNDLPPASYYCFMSLCANFAMMWDGMRTNPLAWWLYTTENPALLIGLTVFRPLDL